MNCNYRPSQISNLQFLKKNENKQVIRFDSGYLQNTPSPLRLAGGNYHIALTKRITYTYILVLLITSIFIYMYIFAEHVNKKKHILKKKTFSKNEMVFVYIVKLLVGPSQ